MRCGGTPDHSTWTYTSFPARIVSDSLAAKVPRPVVHTVNPPLGSRRGFVPLCVRTRCNARPFLNSGGSLIRVASRLLILRRPAAATRTQASMG